MLSCLLSLQNRENTELILNSSAEGVFHFFVWCYSTKNSCALLKDMNGRPQEAGWPTLMLVEELQS